MPGLSAGCTARPYAAIVRRRALRAAYRRAGVGGIHKQIRHTGLKPLAR